MKSMFRFTLGVLSALLLATGLAQAANRIEPLTTDAMRSATDVPLNPVSDCSNDCQFLFTDGSS